MISSGSDPSLTSTVSDPLSYHQGGCKGERRSSSQTGCLALETWTRRTSQRCRIWGQRAAAINNLYYRSWSSVEVLEFLTLQTNPARNPRYTVAHRSDPRCSHSIPRRKDRIPRQRWLDQASGVYCCASVSYSCLKAWPRSRTILPATRRPAPMTRQDAISCASPRQRRPFD